MLYFIRVILICAMHLSFGNKFVPGVDLYVLVSNSMPKSAIHALSYTGKKIDAAMVFRGFIDDSVAKTNKYFRELVDKTGWGGFLHPEVFEDFNVEYGPCFILVHYDIAGTAVKYDKVCGNGNYSAIRASKFTF